MTNPPKPPTLSLDLAPASLRGYCGEVARWLDDELERVLAVPASDPGRLTEAMRYAATSPGKRLRPAVLVAACEALGASRQRALAAATAVELLHAYTLVHDDLPAMDDDDERRGRPTVHIAFGEATAILAGDGLLTLAFERLGELGADAGAAVTVLARRAGGRELLLGQALDLELTGRGAAPSLAELEILHAGKTGALFAAAAELGGICAGASAAQRAQLAEYGMAIGIAFQHADDRDDDEYTEHAAASAARMRQLCERACALAAELAPHSVLDEIARWNRLQGMSGGPAGTALARRRAGLLLALAAAGCGSAAPGRVLARGVLPYDLATGPGQLISVELADRFELVVRDGPRLAHARRLELGPPEVDLRALAVVHPHAYVGSDAGWIWEIDLRTLARQRSFAVGAAVQALAADAHYLVSADASGAVCLRRRGDGALLQCARAPFGIARLRLTDAQLWLTPQGGQGAVAAVWSVPALRDAGTSLEKLSTRTRWRGGDVWAAGQALWWQQGTRRQLLTRMASPIRALAITDAGELAVAAWARALGDAAVVLLSP